MKTLTRYEEIEQEANKPTETMTLSKSRAKAMLTSPHGICKVTDGPHELENVISSWGFGKHFKSTQSLRCKRCKRVFILKDKFKRRVNKW